MPKINSDIASDDEPDEKLPSFQTLNASVEHRLSNTIQHNAYERADISPGSSSEYTHSNSGESRQPSGDASLYQTGPEQLKHSSIQGIAPMQSTHHFRHQERGIEYAPERDFNFIPAINSIPFGGKTPESIERSTTGLQIQQMASGPTQLKPDQTPHFSAMGAGFGPHEHDQKQRIMTSNTHPSSYEYSNDSHWSPIESSTNNSEADTTTFQLVHLEVLSPYMVTSDSSQEFRGDSLLYFTKKAVSSSGRNHSHLMRHAQHLDGAPLHLAGSYGPVGPRLSEAKIAELSECIATSEEPFKYYRAGKLINVFKINSDENSPLVDMIKKYQGLHAPTDIQTDVGGIPSSKIPTDMLANYSQQNKSSPRTSGDSSGFPEHRGSIPDEENTRLMLVAHQLQARMTEKEKKRRQKTRQTQERVSTNLNTKRRKTEDAEDAAESGNPSDGDKPK